MSLEDEIFNAVSGSPVIASKKKKQETYWEFLKNTGPEDMLATGTRARPSNAFMTGDHEVSNEPVPPVPALPVTPSTLGSENSLTGTHSLGTHQDTSRVNSVARSINYEGEETATK